MNNSDIVLIGTTLFLGAIAFVAPYVIAICKHRFFSPKLSIKFSLKPPLCHLTQMRYSSNSKTEKYPVFYFRFKVKNDGKTPAEDCEVYLEKIYKQNSAGEMMRVKDLSPANLKWTGGKDPIKRSIYPDHSEIVDIGYILHPDKKYDSSYWKAKKQEQKASKFVFTIPRPINYSQLDYLLPGKYEVFVSVYARNAKKVAKKFKIAWSGKWKSEEDEMFNELVIR